MYQTLPDIIVNNDERTRGAWYNLIGHDWYTQFDTNLKVYCLEDYSTVKKINLLIILYWTQKKWLLLKQDMAMEITI